jgi:hypothetical protein
MQTTGPTGKDGFKSDEERRDNVRLINQLNREAVARHYLQQKREAQWWRWSNMSFGTKIAILQTISIVSFSIFILSFYTHVLVPTFGFPPIQVK